MWNATLLVAVTEITDPSSRPERLFRQVCCFEDSASGTLTAAGLVTAGTYTLPVGLEYDPVEQEWTGEVTVAGGEGDHEIRASRLDYDDAAMDVDGSERFNQLDVDALDGLAGSTEEDYVDRWDFNANGEIDAEDAAVMQMLVDLRLDSGVFGDVDWDGNINRDDFRGAQGHFDAVLGDVDYIAALDFDLDGEVDGGDQAMFYLLFALQAYSAPDIAGLWKP